MKKCKHEFQWKEKNYKNGIPMNVSIWCPKCGFRQELVMDHLITPVETKEAKEKRKQRFSQTSGAEEQQRVVKIEPMGEGQHEWKLSYRKWRRCGFSNETAVPTELWQKCKCCGLERLVYTRVIKKLYPPKAKKEKELELVQEYLKKNLKRPHQNHKGRA